jgi:hypothetical protein
MQWTMPPRVLQLVASLIVLAALTAFVLGLMSAPQRGGRLPGQKVAGAPAAPASAPIEAAEATPLSQERIEGPPPVEEKPKEEEPPPEAANEAAPADEAANAAAPLIVPPPPSPALSQPADQNAATAFPPDEPPH